MHTGAWRTKFKTWCTYSDAQYSWHSYQPGMCDTHASNNWPTHSGLHNYSCPSLQLIIPNQGALYMTHNRGSGCTQLQAIWPQECQNACFAHEPFDLQIMVAIPTGWKHPDESTHLNAITATQGVKSDSGQPWQQKLPCSYNYSQLHCGLMALHPTLLHTVCVHCISE